VGTFNVAESGAGVAELRADMKTLGDGAILSEVPWCSLM